jgi:hypothetical protein
MEYVLIVILGLAVLYFWFNPPPQEVSIFCKVEMNCGEIEEHSVSGYNKHYGT